MHHDACGDSENGVSFFVRAAQLYIFHKSSQGVLRKTTKTEVFVKKTLTEGIPDYKMKYIIKLFNKVLTKVTFTQNQ
ncbi:MAG: hypothetical protein K2P63_11910, partial [Lachnospiraceae bacterium]|nr:hypothetical protein [Lachnospiraceae bacterium]